MTGTCSLCDLPTPDPPITAGDVDGTFCCRGCLTVARSVDAVEEVDSEAVRERARATRGSGKGDLEGVNGVDRADGVEGTEGAEGADGVERAEEAERAESAHDLAESFLTIDGMHCATCEAFVGLRGEATDGIASVDASYATDTARVRYDPDTISEEDLPSAISGYGYSAGFRDVGPESGRDRDEKTLTRLFVGGVLGALIMPWYVFFLYPSYVGIETGILSADMTTQAGLYIPMGIVAVFSAGVVGYTGWPILRGGYVSLRTGRPNMDLLLSIAILAAFTYSSVALVSGSIHLYYDVAVAIVLVVTAGGYYERSLKRQATGRLAELTEARVRETTRRCPDGTTETVSVDALAPGDEVIIPPGERIPVDGTVSEGVAAVDEQVLTGESLPKTKEPGEEVVGGAVVTDQTLVVTVGEDATSTLDRITALLWDVQSERPGVQRQADRLALVFVPLVLAVAVIVSAWGLLGGGAVDAALLAGLTVLVAACPCAMGLATPLAVAAGLRDALRRGMVVTDATLFESAPDVETVVFDKTGTLTTGEMAVRSVVGDRVAVDLAAAVERHAAHPAGDAIVRYAEEAATDGGQQAQGTPVTDRPETDAAVEHHPGEGVSSCVDGTGVVVGTPALVARETGPLPEDLRDAVEAATADGHLPVVVGVENEPAAVLVVGERARENWVEVVEAFGDSEVVVLTGDESATADSFRDHPAIDQVFAGVPPDGKVAAVERLAAAGTTAMVGDGTNDAPALAAADVGIALQGTARAAEAADVAIVDGELADVPATFDLAAATRRRIRQNIGWALCYNGVAIPLAAAGVLNPLFAALAMAGSSLLVVTNSRRRVL